PPRRGLPEDRPRARRRGAARTHDEARGRKLRAVQRTVRALLEAGRQEAVLDSVLHRRSSWNYRSRHADVGVVAEAARLQGGPGTSIFAVTHGDGDRDVPLRKKPTARQP